MLRISINFQVKGTVSFFGTKTKILMEKGFIIINYFQKSVMGYVLFWLNVLG